MTETAIGSESSAASATKRGASRAVAIGFLAIVLVGLSLRAPGIRTAITDPREAHSAMIARNLVTDGPRGLLYPRLDYGSDGHGYVAQEFPLVNALGAIGLAIFGTEREWPVRLPSLGFYVLGSFFLFDLLRRRAGAVAALGAVALFAFFPLSIERSPSPMTDEAGVVLGVGAIALLDRFLDGGRFLTGLVAASLAALSFLAKAPNLYLVVTLVGLYASRRGLRALVRPDFLVLAVTSVAPIVLWIVHSGRVNQSSELWTGRSALDACVSYLYQKGRFGYYLSRAWYGRLAEHLLQSLTIPGLAVTVTGAVLARRCRGLRAIVAWWALGLLLYVVALPTSLFSFKYYLLPVVPLAAVLGGIALDALARGSRSVPLAAGIGVVALAAIGVVGFPKALAQIRRADENKLAFGAAARKIVPEGSLVIFSAYKMGAWDCSLIYNAHRCGWKFSAHVLDETDPENAKEIADLRRRRQEVGTHRYAVPLAYSVKEALTPKRVEELRAKGAAFFAYWGRPREWLEEQRDLGRYVLAKYPVISAEKGWLFVDLRTSCDTLELAADPEEAGSAGGGFVLAGTAVPPGPLPPAATRVLAWRVANATESGSATRAFGGEIPAADFEPGTLLFEWR